MIKGVVYRYVSPDGSCYVGQTTNENRRRKEFGRDECYRSSKLKAAVEKYGLDSFTYEVLFKKEYTSKEEAISELYEMEMYFIELFDSYKNGYNMTYGGDGVKGFRMEGESKERMIRKLKEYYSTHDNPFKGKSHTDATKKLLSEYASKRTGEKNPFYNKSHKDSTKAKISEAKSVAVIQLDKNTGEILNEFSSALEAGKALGNPRLNSEIIKCCRGYVSPSGRHYLTCKGYKWKYKEQ